MTEFKHVTTKETVETYYMSRGIFESLLTEIKKLSKKKPEAIMSSEKVKIINRVLEDLLTFLKNEPTGKYLDALDDETLPQMSDAVLVMVQFERALKNFINRYQRYVEEKDETFWITKEMLANWEEDEGEYEYENEDDD